MRARLLKLFSQKTDQSGLASIVIVGVLIILLTIISLGFAKIMDRSVNNSLNNQLGAAANYAAQSGLNDAITALKADSGLLSSSCSQLFAAGQPLQNKNNLSGDGNTKYTCVLVDPTPQDLAYQAVPANKSQIVAITTADLSGTPTPPDKLDSLMFSWQSSGSDAGKSSFPAGSTLYDETTWSDNKYAPVLRLTLYPVPDTGQLDQTQADSKTFFFYPHSGSGDTTVVDYQTALDGDLIPVQCDTAHTIQPARPDFSGSADYDCNVVISKLKMKGAAKLQSLYARITPIYNQTDVKVKANENGHKVAKFTGVQASVDVTGKSNSATKRLQARVNLNPNNCGPNDNCAPEEAVRSAKRICKRLNVRSSDVTIDAFNYCDIPIKPPPNPTCTPSAPPYATGKDISFTAGSGYGPGTYSWSGGGTPASGSGDTFTTKYSSPGPETVKVTSKDPLSNNSGTGTCSFDVFNPPTVTLTAEPLSVTVGQSSTLTWVVANSTSCIASDAWSGAKDPSTGTHTQGTGAYGSTGTYRYTIVCSGPGGITPPSKAAVNVTSNPSPPPPPGGGGCGDSAPTPIPGNPEPDPCVRDVIYLSWASVGNVSVRVWASHCYTSLNVGGTGVSWNRSPDDNSSYTDYTVPFDNAGGNLAVTCSGNGIAGGSTYVPAGPPPPSPSPPGGGGGPTQETDNACYDSYVDDSTYWSRGLCSAEQRKFGAVNGLGCFGIPGGGFIHSGGC